MLLKLFSQVLHNTRYNYIKTASQLKETMNISSYCAEYYLVLDTKQLTTLKNIIVLLKGFLIDLRAFNFVHAKTFLPACCVHARHLAYNLSSPALTGYFSISLMEDLFKKKQ